MKRYFFWVLLFFMVACTPTLQQPSVTKNDQIPQQPLSTDEQAYYPPPPISTPYEGPEPIDTPTSEPTATQDPQLGAVRGTILLNGKPVVGQLLFLSDILKDENGNESLVSVDYNTKHRAETTEDGSAIFNNVSPGRYALVLVIIPNSFVLIDPQTQKAITVTVQGGSQTEIGEFDFSELPIPP